MPQVSSKHNPKATVLMSVYNDEETVAEAIESISQQTFGDFKFIIIDDGSTDQSAVVIQSYASQDNRIRFLKNKHNLGLPASLNKGIRQAEGEYIARMDADDFSLPTRLEKQVAFMDQNPRVGISGTAVIAKINGKEKVVWRYPTQSDYIKTQLLFHSSFAHPTVILRRNLIKPHKLYYDESFRRAQDYELWTRVANLTEMRNLTEPLLIYSISPETISSYRKGGGFYERKIRYRQLQNLGLNPTPEEYSLHTLSLENRNNSPETDIYALANWYNKLLESNRAIQVYPQTTLTYLVTRKYFKQLFSLGTKKMTTTLFQPKTYSLFKLKRTTELMSELLKRILPF